MSRTLMGFPSAEHYVFKNLAKGLDSFQSSGTYAFPGDLTADGYPKNGATLTQNIFGVVYFPTNLPASEVFVIKMTNAGGAAGGDFRLGRGAPGFTSVSVSSGSVVGGTGFNLILTGTNPRATFQFATSIPASCSFGFETGGTFSGASNLVICRLSDEAAIDAITSPNEMFNEDYLNVYRALNNKVFRPMGWSLTNNSNVSQYGYRMRWDTGLSCFAAQWPPGAWAGTIAGTNTYTCSSPPDISGEPVFGSVVTGQVTNANTSTTPTLKTAGMAAGKTIVNIQGNALVAGEIAANVLCTFVFDDILNKWIYQAGSIYPSVPIQVQVGLCNKLNTSFWRNIPTLYDDASVTAEAAYVRANLNSGLTAYWEYSNETWNFAGGFPQTTWLLNRGIAIGIRSGDDRRQFGAHALRHRQMMGLITTAWSPRTTAELKRVMGVQSFGIRTVGGGTDIYRLQGRDLLQDNGTNGGTNYTTLIGTAYNSSPNRPIDYTDVISPAQYTEGAQCVQFDAGYVANFNAGLNINNLTAAADTLNVAFLDNDVRAGTTSAGNLGPATLSGYKNGSPAGGTAIYSSWNAIAASYSPTKTIEWYEGACGSCTYPSTSTCTTIGISTAYGGPGGKIDLLIQAWKLSSLFYATCLVQLNDAVSETLSATPAWLQTPGPGIWSLYTDDIFSQRLQSHDAIADFNDAGPRAVVSWAELEFTPTTGVHLISASFGGAGALTAGVTQVSAAGTHSISASFGGAGAFRVQQIGIPGAAFQSDAFQTNAFQAQVAQSIAASFAGAGAFTAQVLKAPLAITASFVGAGAFTAQVLKAPIAISAAFAGAGNFSGSLSARLTISATFAGAGALTGDLVKAGVQPIGAVFSGAGAFSSSLRQTGSLSATFGGVGTLVADVTLISGVAAPAFQNTAFQIDAFQTAAIAGADIGAIFAGRGALAAVASQQLSVAATFAGAGALAANATRFQSLSASFQGVGTLTALGSLQMSIAATFAGAGNLGADMVIPGHATAISALFAGQGALASTLTQRMGVFATFQGAGALSSTLNQRLGAAATFAGIGALTSFLSQRHSISATYAGVGILNANLNRVIGAANQLQAGFAGVGNLTAQVSARYAASVQFTGTGVMLIGVLTQRQSTKAAFNGTGGLTADVTIPGAAGADLQSTFFMVM